MTISFDQAYWYTNDCPLRQLKDPVLVESKSAQNTKDIIHNTLINIFDKPNDLSAKEILDRVEIPSVRKGMSKKLIAENLNQVIINYSIWKSKHRESITIDKNIKETVNKMDISVDIARFKDEGEFIQLIWFDYSHILPSRLDFSKMVQLANWNAKGFELLHKLKPMQLTYYFPVVGTEYSVLYNVDNGYDSIAKLISENVYYIKPSEVCDVCTQCPMTWVGYHDRK